MAKTAPRSDKKTSHTTKARATRSSEHPASQNHKLYPSQVTDDVGAFDRFAQAMATIAGRAIFFAFCVLMILLWVPTIFLMKFDTSQLLINTSTTIITFLMVALLQNSQSRADKAVQHKLNAIADSLADHMESGGRDSAKAKKDAKELREAIGLEFVESSDG